MRRPYYFMTSVITRQHLVSCICISAGWVTVLAKWQRSCHLALSLIAVKTLANMDIDRNRVRQPYADSVFVYHPMFRGDGYDPARLCLASTFSCYTVLRRCFLLL